MYCKTESGGRKELALGSVTDGRTDALVRIEMHERRSRVLCVFWCLLMGGMKHSDLASHLKTMFLLLLCPAVSF